ncbi:MAG: allantoicase, partial [Gammaproteobacteria bacterium]
YPDKCSVQGGLIRDEDDSTLARIAELWPELLTPQKLEMDTQHFFDREVLTPIGEINCVRLNIFPDGGVSRLRVFGRPRV